MGFFLSVRPLSRSDRYVTDPSPSPIRNHRGNIPIPSIKPKLENSNPMFHKLATSFIRVSPSPSSNSLMPANK